MKIKDKDILNGTKSLDASGVGLVFLYIVIPILNRGELHDEPLVSRHGPGVGVYMSESFFKVFDGDVDAVLEPDDVGFPGSVFARLWQCPKAVNGFSACLARMVCSRI